MTALELRASTPADVEALFDVWRRAVAATHSFVSEEDRDRIADLVRQHYLPTAPLTVACDADGKPLAFMGMTGNSIDSLFVDPDRHGQGVGRVLVELAMARYPNRVTVEVNEQNEGAAGFYRHLGFSVTARSPVDGQGKPYPLLTMAWPGASDQPADP
ncbi:MAG: acetyltransferase [Pseudomonadota bacterium]